MQKLLKAAMSWFFNDLAKRRRANAKFVALKQPLLV
jgi:hypothetical protein